MRILAILVLLAVLGTGGVAAWNYFGPVEIEAAAPVRDTAVDAIYATGSVEPTVMLPIAPRVAGTLAQLLVDEGSTVRKGQVLALIDDSDLGQTVEELSARAAFARENFERTKNLVEKHFVSPGDLDKARSDRDAAEAQLRRARVQREFTALVAPADGLVIRRDGEVGQYFPAGQAIFTLSCCAPLRVTAQVDEEDIRGVHVGQKVIMKTDAVPDRVFDGTVASITGLGDSVQRSFRVRIRLADPGPLRVGMTIDANLVVAERKGALLVPTAALQSGSVWIVREGRLHRQAVRTGVVGGTRAEILEGVPADAIVVAAPDERLREGRRARVKTPA